MNIINNHDQKYMLNTRLIKNINVAMTKRQEPIIFISDVFEISSFAVVL